MKLSDWVVLTITLALLGLIFLIPPKTTKIYSGTAIIKWSNAPKVDTEWLDYMGHYDFVAFTSGVWDNMPGVKDSLRIRNPAIRTGTYFNIHTIAQWQRRAFESGRPSYAADLWETLSPHMAKTTEGDTACIWLNNPVYDFTSPVVRGLAIITLRNYVVRNDLDWVFLDFFSVVLPDLKRFQAQVYQDNEHGSLDFDQNGVGYWDDPGEQAMVIEAEYAYMRELRLALPPNVLLIPNGNLAIFDDEFAKLCDGLFLEQFPWFFWGSQGPEWDNAVDPGYPSSLHFLTAPSRYYSDPGFIFVEDRFNAGNYGGLSDLFNGIVETKNQRLETEFPPLPVRFADVPSRPVLID